MNSNEDVKTRLESLHTDKVREFLTTHNPLCRDRKKTWRGSFLKQNLRMLHWNASLTSWRPGEFFICPVDSLLGSRSWIHALFCSRKKTASLITRRKCWFSKTSYWTNRSPNPFSSSTSNRRSTPSWRNTSHCWSASCRKRMPSRLLWETSKFLIASGI